MQKERKKRKEHRLARRALERKPKFQGWKTTDEEEIERRRLRASIEPMTIQPLEPDHPFYGTFSTTTKGGGGTYLVEIRSLNELENSCQCRDYQTNGLGTCKHIEAVLLHLRRRGKGAIARAVQEGSSRTEVYVSRRGTPEIRVTWPAKTPRQAREVLEPFFSSGNTLLADPVEALPAIKRALLQRPPQVQRIVRIGRNVENWVSDLARRKGSLRAREGFLEDVKQGKRTMHVCKLPLYPYQQEGVLYLAFGERVLLADDMGLGKTVQAIGACELLRQTRKIERVLVVCPASLKAEWEDQIAKFTGLTVHTILGPRAARLKAYRNTAFFYITNYEQVRSDVQDIQQILAPDVVILDEAQRIKNWQTKTAKAVKRLASPFAFVLTGTPLENRIDEIYSIVEFLDPQVFGPLFRFNRDFYELDEKGHPAGYRNLDELHRRIRPVMLRRLKEEVEDQLPERTVNNFFVEMEAEQRGRYEEYRERVARLLAVTSRRPLTKEEFERLQRYLACMRMICDTPFILDPDCRICPKLSELAAVLEELTGPNGHKVLVFSEWERMLFLVRDLAEEMGLAFAWHTGSVPQQKRRTEIRRFKNDPDCRLFLSTDSGGVGLNLQEASAVVNLDLPWNPAKLEQRIARAWRKHQTRPVSVINLVSERSIEHRMLTLLGQKQQLADGVLDGRGDFTSIKMPSGRVAFLERLDALMGREPEPPPAEEEERPAAAKAAAIDPYQAFREDMVARLSDRLLLLEAHRTSGGRPVLLAVLDGPADSFQSVGQRLLHESFEGAGDGPALELMDRATYETIQRLTAAGILKSEMRSVEQLHRSPAFPSPAPQERVRFVKEAQGVFSRADRKGRMGFVLAGGGFPVESLAALGEAVELALKAAAYLAGAVDAANGETVPLSLVASRMVPEDLVPEAAVAMVARLREARQGPDGIGEEVAQEFVASARKLMEHVSQALNRCALG